VSQAVQGSLEGLEERFDAGVIVVLMGGARCTSCNRGLDTLQGGGGPGAGVRESRALLWQGRGRRRPGDATEACGAAASNYVVNEHVHEHVAAGRSGRTVP
jgi:hypothetical protein